MTAAPGARRSPRRGDEPGQRAERVRHQRAQRRQENDEREQIDEASRVVHGDERRAQHAGDRSCRRPACRAPTARPKTRGNSPSCATAIGSWPTIRIQPFSAPKQEIAAPERDRRGGADRPPARAPLRQTAPTSGRAPPARARHHADGADDVDDAGEQGARHRRARDRALGIADAAGGNRRALQAEERPQRQRRRGGDAAARSRGRRSPRSRSATGSRTNSPATPTTASGRIFRTVVTTCTRPAVRTPRTLTAVSSHSVADGERRRRDGVPDDRGEERIEVADERHRERGVRAPHRNPVAPGDEEPGEVAERLARVGVRTAGRGVQPRQPREDQREQDRAGRRDEPADRG